MSEHSTKFSVGFAMFLFAGLLASVLIGFSGNASAESWEGFKSKHEYSEAVHNMDKCYAENGKVDRKLGKD